MDRERPLTLEEVCEHYRMSERAVRDVVRKHQVPVLTTGRGRAIRFDSIAQAKFEEALRTCTSTSKSDPTVQASTKLSAPSQDTSSFDRLLGRSAATKPLSKPKRRASRPKCSETKQPPTSGSSAQVIAIGRSRTSPKLI